MKAICCLYIFGLFLVICINRGDSLHYHVRSLIKGLKSSIRGSRKMVSIDWQQTADSEDGIKYAHDEVTCKDHFLIRLLVLFCLFLHSLRIFTFRSYPLRGGSSYSAG